MAHLVVLSMVVGMIGLGLWQLRRLDERRDRNALVEARTADAPVPLAAGLNSGADIRFVQVEMTGSYTGDSLFVDNRSINGAPGSWLATPFTSEGTTVLVIRGFLGRAAVLNATPDSVAPPDGEITLTGSLQPGDRSGRFAQGREGIAGISHPNVEAIAERFDIPMANAFVLLSSPAEEDASPVPPPPLDEGSHFSYAIQWFLFATIAGVGYWLILRRSAGNQMKSVPQTLTPSE